MFFLKQLGFQVNNSKYHAILALADDILTLLEKRQFSLVVFIDVLKAFDTFNQNIL